MQRLRTDIIYAVTINLGGKNEREGQAIYLGKSTNKRIKTKETILFKNNSSELILYRFNKFKLKEGINLIPERPSNIVINPSERKYLTDLAKERFPK